MAVEFVDVFADKEEELRLQEQARRNMLMRDRLRMRAKSALPAVDDVFKASSSYVCLQNADSEPSGETRQLVDISPWHKQDNHQPKVDNAFLAFHEEIVSFTQWLSFTPEEDSARLNFLARIRTSLSDLWPESYMVVFGSSFTELALPSSDIDVAVMNVPTGAYSSPGDCLKLLANTLLKLDYVSFVEVRDKARIPLLVLKDKYQPSIEVDITINVDSPLGTSRFIQDQAVNRFPQFKPLVLFLKSFVLQRSLHDTYFGGVGSYLLSCMVLGFLQQHRALQDGLSLGHLLFDFFSYFGREFNSSRDGLSVLGRGSTFDKLDHDFESTGPRRVSMGESLCVESPLEPHLDIGNKCFQWKVVKQAFLQGRLEMIHQVQHFDKKSDKSMLSPGLVNGSHELFKRIGVHQQKLDLTRKRKRSDSQDS